MTLPTKLTSVLSAFETQAAAIHRSIADLVDSKPTPPIVYHFTNRGGLEGILKNGTIWLSDLFSLNDPSEMGHGLLLALESVEELAKTAPPVYKIFAELYSEFAKYGHQEIAHFFTASFSCELNNIGQWQAYADDGRGFALGFNTMLLEEIHKKQTEGARGSFLVQYDDDLLKKTVESLVQSSYPVLTLIGQHQYSSDVSMEFMKRMSAALSMELVNTASIFKHTGFRNEVEFRLLEIHSINKPPLSKKRGSPPKTINYTELDWRTASPAALESIVVGPAANFSEAESFVHDYRSNAGLQSVKVIKSGIPYRSTN